MRGKKRKTSVLLYRTQHLSLCGIGALHVLFKPLIGSRKAGHTPFPSPQANVLSNVREQRIQPNTGAVLFSA